MKNSVSGDAADDDATEAETDTTTTTTSPLRPSDGHRETFDDSRTTTDPHESSKSPSSGTYDVGGAKRRRPAVRRRRSSMWTNFPFIVYCVVVASVQGCIQSVLIFLPARARELGARPNAAALLLTIFGVADMVGRFAFGYATPFGVFLMG